jgi:alpha-tubulin suppressor-like RCC1 family protein
MFSGTKLISIIISIIILITNATFADWKENAKAVDVSGGEDHTLVLTANKCPWGCGDNYYYQLGIGDSQSSQLSLVRVHDGDMNTPSGYLEDIVNIGAGWKHSLALDANGFVWSWGYNSQGQLGDNQQSSPYYSSTPIQVHGLNNIGYLENIIAISAGRSGRHSLALDANNFVWGWGYNEYGQCGNDISESNEFTPVRVLAGQQEPNDPNAFLKNIVAIFAGADQSMALEKDDPNDPNFAVVPVALRVPLFPSLTVDDDGNGYVDDVYGWDFACKLCPKLL